MMNMNLKRNRIVIGWLFLTLLFLVPSVATAANLTINDPVILEGDSGPTIIAFDVTLDATPPAVSGSFDVRFSTTDGTATAGDYVGISTNTYTFSGAPETRQILVTVNGDTAIEQDETFEVNISLAPPAPAEVNLVKSQGIGTITNDDEAAIGITYSGGAVAEPGTASFVLSETNGVTLDTDYTVSLSFSGTGITAGDYTDPGVITVNSGNLPLTVNVPILDDSLIEPTETLAVALVDPDGGDQVNFAGSATVDITSSNTAAIGITYSGGAVAEPGTASFVLSETNGVTLDTDYTVSLSFSGTGITAGDYTDPGVITVNSGNLPLTVNVPILDDNLIEPTETLAVALVDPDGGDQVNFAGSATVDITSSNTAAIGITYSGGAVAEPGTASFVLSETNGVTLDTDYTVSLSFSGTGITAGDYTDPGVITVNSGNLPLTVNVPILDDNLIEPTETLAVALVDPDGGDQVNFAGSATVDITSSNTAAIGITYSGGAVAEPGTASFVLSETNGVTLDTDYTVSLSFSGTGITAGDYTDPGVITVNSGNLPLTVNVPILDDNLIEPTETLAVALVDPDGGDQVNFAGSATVDITSSNTAAIGITYSGGAVAEPGTASFVLSETNGVTLDTDYTVSLSFSGAGITAGDYTDPGVITVNSGNLPLTVNVPILDDNLIEPTETLAVALVDPDGGDQVNFAGSATVDITSSNTAAIGITYSGGAVAEPGTASFVLSETNGVTLDTDYTVSLSFSGTGITAGDYTDPGVITVNSGNLPLTVNVPILDDSLIEPTETLAVALVDPDGGDQVNFAGSATVDITSSNTAAIGITYSGGAVAEPGTASFVLSETNGVTLDTDYTVSLSFSGTGITAGDYTDPGVITVNSGNLPLTVNVPILDDSLIEPTETLAVALVDPDGGDQVNFAGSATVDITSSNTAAIGITYSGGAVAEPGTASFVLSETNGVTLDTDYTVSLSFSGAGITAGDYTDPGVITVNSGNLPLTVNVPILDDNLIEPTETLAVALVDPDGGDQVNFAGSATVDITSSNTAAIGITYSGGAVAEPGTASFVLSETNGVTLDTDYTVSLSFSGTGITAGDYTDPGVITVNSGNLPLTVNVPILDDGLWEPNETLSVGLVDPDGGDQVNFAGSASCTIDNTNDINFALTATTGTVNEESDTTASFSIDRTGAAIESGHSINIDYNTQDDEALAGQDYTSTSGTATFTGNETVESFTVSILNDNYVEPDQLFQAVLTAPGLDNVAVLTPTADCDIQSGDTTEASISPAIPTTVAEGDVTGAYTVNLSNPVEGAGSVSVDWTAVSGTATVPDDFDVSTGTVTLGPLATSTSFNVDTAADMWVEGSENFSVQLTAASVDTVTYPTISAGDITASTVAVGPTTISEDDIADVTIGPPASLTVQESIDPLAMEIDFTIALDRYVLGPSSVVVNYQTIPLSATSADFVNTSGSITFPGSASPVGPFPTDTVTFQVLNDHDIETDETFLVRFTNGTNANILTPTPGVLDFTVTITDNEVTIRPTYHGGAYQDVNSGNLTIEGTTGADYIADIGEVVDIALNWDHGLQTFSISGTSLIGAISGTGSVGTDSPGSDLYLWTVPAGTAGTIIPVDVGFRHNLRYTVGAHGTAIVSVPPSPAVPNTYNYVVDHNSNVDFTFNGDVGVERYCVSDVRVGPVSTGAVSVGAVDNYTVSSIQEDTELYVDFRANRVTTTIEPAEVANAAALDERGMWKLLDGSGNEVDPQHPTVTGYEEWNYSGEFVRTDCHVSNFTIQFREVPGWTTPDPINVTVDTSTTGELNFTGVYLPKAYVLTLDQSHLDGGPLGTIMRTPVGEEGNHTPPIYRYIYQSGQTVELTAEPDVSSVFRNWTGTISSTSPTITFTMDSDKSLVAVYSAPSSDLDGDGFDNTVDCNDSDAGIYPGALEICGDGIDQDCSGADDPCGADDLDNDGDGYSPSQGDCNDNDDTIYPGAYDIPGDGIDQDCYGGDRGIQTTETTCVKPAEVPLETQVQAAPPLIMFLIDDSGSMDFETMTNENEGVFAGRAYLYGNTVSGVTTDNVYRNASRYLTETERRLWRGMWAGHNRLYFDPAVEYDPWARWSVIPGTDNYGPGLPANADPNNPRMNPVENSRTMPLDTIYYSVYSTAGARPQYIEIEADDSRRTVADVIRLQGANGTFYIDNNIGDGQGGRTGYYTEEFGASDYTGNWSDRDDGDAYGDGSRTTYTNGARARWYVKVPAGTYDVDVWIPSMYNLSRNTDYHIYHDGGTTNEWNFSQQYRVNTWREIGDDLYFSDSSATRYDIPVAHYFATDGGTGDVYLVAMTGGSFTYYLYTDSNNNDRVDDGELSLPGSVPASVQPSGTYAEVRQNFANWYSFYRRRELTAKSAIGQVIDRMEESQIGMAVLNNRGTYNHTVRPVKSNALGDQSAQLLTWLYAINSNGGTPLRRGLQDVGQYFDLHDGGSSGYLSSTPPWASEAAGGGCQRAFAIAMTDGYYNGSDSTVESPLRTLNADSDGVNRDNQPSGFDRGVFLGPNNGSSPTLADISMYYYENDLNRSLTNVVPSHNYDIANHQHMTTFGVAFGVHGEIDPVAWPDCLPKCDPTDIGCYDPVCPTWVAPTNQPRKIDDLYHAAVNGRGQFFTADDPQQLLNALLAVMQGIQNTAATGSSVAINAQELQGDTALYQATYVPRNWTGDVKAKPLDPNTGGVVQELDASNNLVDRVDWSAADQIDGAAWTGRKIITYNDASTSGAIFDYAFISPAQRLLLDSTPAVADAMIDFVRGDTSLSLANGGVFRDRDSLLGDIVHASPVPYRWDRTQPGVVFVGANDGMLHMLDEVTGNEIFGYVPNLAFANLRDLTIAPYVHKYFVDNEPYITKLGSTGQTILVGGMGRGGRGYYCLDISGVSNPAFDAETNAAAMVKWEYPVNSNPENKTVDPDMGYSFSQAYAVNSADGWVVIFGNGYDSQNGEAVLYVLPIDSNGNQLSAPTKIRTYVGDAGPNCNGLSTPALIDVNQDGLVDFAFAGDLLGNMWKFDLRDSSISNWTVAYNTQADGSGMPQPLFQAKNQAGFRQPITTRPDVMRQCRAGLDGYLVLFGTGRYLGLDDFADADAIQSLYGIWDWGDAWENLNSVQHSASRRDPTDKFLGEFDTNRQLSNLVNNAAIPDTEQTLYVVGLGSAGPGDEVRINGRTFTFSNLTNVENYEFLGSAGLQACVNDSTYGVPDVFAQASPAYVVLRTEPPGGSIAVTATPGVELGTIDLKVTLASQNVIYADDDFVVVSKNPVEWFDPRTSTGLHAGWYFDMPGTSERLVNDVIIRDGILYAVPNIPSESPCEAGGNSIIYALNACTGGGLWTVFDIDGDGRVNNADLINIGTAANPIWVAPSGLRRGGLLYSPAILTIPGTNKDVLHFSTSSGNLETEIAIAEKLGFLYWRTW